MLLYADHLFVGGRIYTADPHGLWVDAVAVRGEHILATGSAAALAEFRGPDTELTDLRGRLLVPGFTDSHIHFVETALRAAQIDATQASSAGKVAELVGARVAGLPEGAWMRGGGWHSAGWTDGSRAHRSLLDTVAPDVAVALDSKDLHSLWLNSTALRRAGISQSTPDIAGGVIERDECGEPTGVLRDNAMSLAEGVFPELDLDVTVPAVRDAIPAAWRAGIVAIHNATDTADGLSLRTYQELRRGNQLGLRVLQNLPVESLDHLRAIGLRSGFGDAWLRIGGLKMFADGALGSRTALMLQPYLDQPDNRGVATMDFEEMLESALAGSKAGFSLTIHAIGDRANRQVLDVLTEVRRQEGGAAGSAGPLRHRVEHVQCITAEDLPRLAKLDLIASVQPIHATSDMTMVERGWGPARAPNAYAFRRLYDSGAVLVFGSDAPVEPYPPLIGIHAAVTRRRADGSPGLKGWQGQERLTFVEAVDAYTRWPAYAAGEEGYRGTISPGKLADLVVLSQDIAAGNPMDILAAQVDLTLIGGRVVWRRTA